MKVSAYTKPLIITVICLFTIGLIQGQEKTIRHKPLNFTVSYEPIKSKTKGELYNIVIRADGKAIKKTERVYVRIIDPSTGENLFVRAINMDIQEGKVSISDSRFKMAEMNKKELRLNFGSFKKGSYEVFIKIKDKKRNMYFNRKKITL